MRHLINQPMKIWLLTGRNSEGSPKASRCRLDGMDITKGKDFGSKSDPTIISLESRLFHDRRRRFKTPFIVGVYVYDAATAAVPGGMYRNRTFVPFSNPQADLRTPFGDYRLHLERYSEDRHGP